MDDVSERVVSVVCEVSGDCVTTLLLLLLVGSAVDVGDVPDAEVGDSSVIISVVVSREVEIGVSDDVAVVSACVGGSGFVVDDVDGVVLLLALLVWSCIVVVVNSADEDDVVALVVVEPEDDEVFGDDVELDVVDVELDVDVVVEDGKVVVVVDDVDVVVEVRVVEVVVLVSVNRGSISHDVEPVETVLYLVGHGLHCVCPP